MKKQIENYELHTSDFLPDANKSERPIQSETIAKMGDGSQKYPEQHASASDTGEADQRHSASPRRNPINRVAFRIPPNFSSAHTFPERLIALRLQSNLTQVEVAQRTTVRFKHKSEPRPLARTTLCMYEAGRAEPTLDTIVRLAKTFGVSPGWLAFG